MNTWTRSTYCGKDHCVEVAFTKSSYSSSNNCVEIAHHCHHVHVRDSKNTHGTILQFTPTEWATFTQAIKTGEFDTP